MRTTCQSCKHWERTNRGARPDERGIGLCRRYPPQIVGIDPLIEGGSIATERWPITVSNETCGEHALGYGITVRSDEP